MNNNELKHFGIKGMRWGVRRYQNADGSYTKAGKKRYAKNLAYRDKLAMKADKRAQAFRDAGDEYKRNVRDLKKYGKNSRQYEKYVADQVDAALESARMIREAARSKPKDPNDPYRNQPETETERRRREEKEAKQKAADMAADLGIMMATKALYSSDKVAADAIAKLIRDNNSDAGEQYRYAERWAKTSENLKNMEVTALNKKEIRKTYWR